MTVPSTQDATGPIEGEVVRATVEIEAPVEDPETAAESKSIDTVPPQRDPAPHRPHRQARQFPDVDEGTATSVNDDLGDQDEEKSEQDTTDEDSEPDNKDPEVGTEQRTDLGGGGESELGTYQVSDYGFSQRRRCERPWRV